jgi:hypothetical protein
MNLFKVWREINENEVYDSIIVAAESEEEARYMHPESAIWNEAKQKWDGGVLQCI